MDTPRMAGRQNGAHGRLGLFNAGSRGGGRPAHAPLPDAQKAPTMRLNTATTPMSPSVTKNDGRPVCGPPCTSSMYSMSDVMSGAKESCCLSTMPCPSYAMKDRLHHHRKKRPSAICSSYSTRKRVDRLPVRSQGSPSFSESSANGGQGRNP